jgi:restriction endonuclease Mrr
MTSTFTQDARGFADQVADNVVLIDGARLTALMIERGLGSGITEPYASRVSTRITSKSSKLPGGT